MLIATIPQKRRFRLTVIAHIKQCNDARTRVSADGRTDMVDQKAFIAETVFDEISNILCIFDAVAVADENDVILVTPETKSQGLFHQIQEEVTFCGLLHEAYA